MEILEPYLALASQGFTPANVNACEKERARRDQASGRGRKGQRAAAGRGAKAESESAGALLLRWVRAVVAYHRFARAQRLRERLSVLERASERLVSANQQLTGQVQAQGGSTGAGRHSAGWEVQRQRLARANREYKARAMAWQAAWNSVSARAAP